MPCLRGYGIVYFKHVLEVGYAVAAHGHGVGRGLRLKFWNGGMLGHPADFRGHCLGTGKENLHICKLEKFMKNEAVEHSQSTGDSTAFMDYRPVGGIRFPPG